MNDQSPGGVDDEVRQGDIYVSGISRSKWEVIRLTEQGFAEVRCIEGGNKDQANTVSIGLIQHMLRGGQVTRA